MKTRHLDLADVVQKHASAYLARYGKATFPEQRRVLRDIAACRTATLGGHVKKCDQCGHTEVFYDSCRNRHCPKCQAAARAECLPVGLRPGDGGASSGPFGDRGVLPLRVYAR